MGMRNMQMRKCDTHMAGVFPKANVIALLLAVFGLLSLLGCRNPFGLQDTAGNESAGTGILSLTIGRQVVTRTIMPEDIPENDIVRFDFDFVAADPPSGGNFTIVLTKDDDGYWTDGDGAVWQDMAGVELELYEGTWNLRVTAFIGAGGGGASAVASGGLDNILVSSGETVAGNVMLFPIAGGGGDGQGTFFWEVNFSTCVVRARMEIRQVDGTPIPSLNPFYLVRDDGGATYNPHSDYLDVGRYLVVFTLYSDQGQNVEVSAILHIYRNMVSRFTGGDVFPDFSFPRSLLCSILYAWDNPESGEWNFTYHRITAEHFGLLGINGIDTMNFGAIVGWFNDLSYPNNAPGDENELRALVDVALIGINMDSIINIIADMSDAAQNAKEAAIRALPWFADINTDHGDVVFYWYDDTVTVTVLGIYEVVIDFAEDIDDILWVAVAVGSPETTAINFVFGAAVNALDADDITVEDGTGSVQTGALTITTGTDDGRSWSLAVTGVTTPGYVTVSIDRLGIAKGPQMVTVITAPVITWTAIARGTPYTTAIDFVLSVPVSGLTEDDITIGGMTDAITIGGMTGSGTLWSLAVSSTADSVGVSVSINRDGIAGGSQTVTVTGPVAPVQPITWSVDPYNDPYTTAIDFTFSAAVEGLTVNQVTVINGTGAAATNPAIPPVILDDDGKRWRVAVNTTMAGTVVVAINRPGVESSPTPITVSGPHIGWNVTTVGTPTSAVVFTFDDPVITGLEQHHFSILPGTASVTWGNLTGGGNTWTLEVNEVVTAGNISVRIIRDGVVNKEQTVTVSSGLNFIDTPSTLSAGRSHAVAVGTDGSIFVWGHRHTAGSSYGSVPTRRVVGLVPQLDGWKSVAAGQSHTMAIRETDGSLWGWGANSFGQLGNGGNANLPSAVIVPGGHSWRFVTAGGNHTVAIRADGTLWAWGDNGYGQLGNGTTSGTVNSPVQVGTYSDWRFVSAGESHTVAIRADGTLWAWGNNEFGRLGLGGDDETNRNTPHQVQSGTTWALASAGTEHTVAITADGTILAWGASWGHRLGIGDGWNATPTPILGTEAFTWRYVSTGYDHTIAIRGDGSLWGWGFNSHGQVRAEGAQVVALSSITIPEGPTDWARVSTGHNYTIATGTDGTLWSWGYNTGGQLGRGVSPPASGQVVVP